MALTLGESRPLLWQYVSSVAYETAQNADIQKFDSTLNRLCQRLIIEGKWKTCWRRVTLRSYGNKITLPRYFSTCLGADPICDTGGYGGPALRIGSWLSEFAVQGPGLTSDCARACAIRGLIPVSDTAQTFAEPGNLGTILFPTDTPENTAVFKLRAKSTKSNGRGFTLVGGLDENGEIIEDVAKLDVNNGTTTTTQEYSQMPFIEKAITPAYVEFYSVDTTTTDETLLCVYAPSDTVPAYKQYVVPSAEDGNTFACVCKLQHVPAINDSDLIIPSVVDALVTGLQAFQFRDRNDFERYGQYMGDAVQTLDSDLSNDTQAEVPPFQMSSGYACDTIPQMWGGGWY